MLEKFRAAKAPEIEALKRLESGPGLPAPYAGNRPSFSQAILGRGPGAVVAEYKRASPSRGEINLSLEPGEIASMYADAGAACVSVLTEEVYFKGSLDYLDAMAGPGIPLLRKDFLFDVLQVRQTAAHRASALLLIARMIERTAYLDLMRETAEHLGMEAVVEVFDCDDLKRARAAQARIIQVNNRDLDTLATDLNNSRTLIRNKKPCELWICASGIEEPGQVREMAELGFDAVLVGTSLMSSDDPGGALKELVEWRTT